MTIVDDSTNPSTYITNTDETDALALDVALELGLAESVGSAVCELVNMSSDLDVTSDGFPASATVAGTVVTQRFDARPLTEGPYRWVWNVTLNTGAVRSYLTILRVRNHD